MTAADVSFSRQFDNFLKANLQRGVFEQANVSKRKNIDWAI